MYFFASLHTSMLQVVYLINRNFHDATAIILSVQILKLRFRKAVAIQLLSGGTKYLIIFYLTPTSVHSTKIYHSLLTLLKMEICFFPQAPFTKGLTRGFFTHTWVDVGFSAFLAPHCQSKPNCLLQTIRHFIAIIAKCSLLFLNPNSTLTTLLSVLISTLLHRDNRLSQMWTFFHCLNFFCITFIAPFICLFYFALKMKGKRV